MMHDNNAMQTIKARRSKGVLQRGFTLLEFMVVMALIAMALAVTVINFGEANTKREATQAVSDMKEIIYQTRMLKDPIAGYLGLSEYEVATQPGFPQKLCRLGDCAANGIESPAFGQVSMIYSISTNFTVVIGPLSNADCIALASRMIYDVDEISVYNSTSGYYLTNLMTRSVVQGSSTSSPRDYAVLACHWDAAGLSKNYISFRVNQ